MESVAPQTTPRELQKTTTNRREHYPTSPPALRQFLHRDLVESASSLYDRIMVREVLEAVSSESDEPEARTGEELLRSVQGNISKRIEDAEQQLLEAERRESQTRRERLLPDWETLDNLTRYEGHLQRMLSSTINQLRALQARREASAPPSD